MNDTTPPKSIRAFSEKSSEEEALLYRTTTHPRRPTASIQSFETQTSSHWSPLNSNLSYICVGVGEGSNRAIASVSGSVDILTQTSNPQKPGAGAGEGVFVHEHATEMKQYLLDLSDLLPLPLPLPQGGGPVVQINMQADDAAALESTVERYFDPVHKLVYLGGLVILLAWLGVLMKVMLLVGFDVQDWALYALMGLVAGVLVVAVML